MALFGLQGDKLIRAKETNVELEQHIETWLENSPRAVIQDEFILWIGRQPSARDEEGTIFPDLLGVDAEGNLIIVEIKQGRTPRDVVAQLLEYAAWANELSEEQIHEIAEAYFEKRDEFRDKTFTEAFTEVFGVLDTDEPPPLNRKLRLFVVAGEIHPRVVSVCRFLQTSYKMDVSCIEISKFQAESGEEIVSVETKVGNEEIGTPKTRQQQTSPSSRWSGDRRVEEVVLETAQKVTGGDVKNEFTIKEIKKSVLEKYPDFNPNTIAAQIVGACPDHPSYHYHYSNAKYYSRIGTGKYRLYDPERDEIQNGDE